MSRRTQLVIFFAALFVGGLIAFFVTRNNNNDNQANTSQEASSEQASGFNPVSTEGVEFAATITTQKDGQAMTATLEYDDQKNTRYVSSVGGQQSEVIYTSSAYYTCQGGECIKFPVSQSANSGVNPGDYTVDSSDIAGYRSNAKSLGKRDCPAGTCDVWQTTTQAGTAMIYVDTDTKRISQIESTISGATSKIVYDYKDINITVPANAREFSAPAQ